MSSNDLLCRGQWFKVAIFIYSFFLRCYDELQYHLRCDQRLKETRKKFVLLLSFEDAV